jgi:hypothetical protein
VFGDILLTSDGFYRLICKSIHKFGDPGPKNFLNFEALPLPGIENENILKTISSAKLASFYQLKFKLEKVSEIIFKVKLPLIILIVQQRWSRFTRFC